MQQITFNCPKCRQLLEAPEEMSGDLVDCPSCSAAVEVPFRGNVPRGFRPAGRRPVPGSGSPATSAAANDIERMIARQKSYVGPAVVTFFVYWLFWLPGLIVNLVYLSEANRTAAVAGEKPAGHGCLVALLIVLVILPAAFFLLFLVLGMLGAIFM